MPPIGKNLGNGMIYHDFDYVGYDFGAGPKSSHRSSHFQSQQLNSPARNKNVTMSPRVNTGKPRSDKMSTVPRKKPNVLPEIIKRGPINNQRN